MPHRFFFNINIVSSVVLLSSTSDGSEASPRAWLRRRFVQARACHLLTRSWSWPPPRRTGSLYVACCNAWLARLRSTCSVSALGSYKQAKFIIYSGRIDSETWVGFSLSSLWVICSNRLVDLFGLHVGWWVAFLCSPEKPLVAIVESWLFKHSFLCKFAQNWWNNRN